MRVGQKVRILDNDKISKYARGKTGEITYACDNLYVVALKDGFDIVCYPGDLEVIA